mmetsp:Transcript_28676/g.69048  ORF Transcript_28676/g.69048 Transcript_28676/m.69048 type:complete len:85 (-) Transcript_28676:27-281(-)
MELREGTKEKAWMPVANEVAMMAEAIWNRIIRVDFLIMCSYVAGDTPQTPIDATTIAFFCSPFFSVLFPLGFGKVVLDMLRLRM